MVERSKGLSGWAKAAILLTAIGAINWGLVGLFEWNLVEAIFGGGVGERPSGFSRFLYVLVGIAGVATLFLLPKRSEAPTHRERTFTGPRREVHP